jgi:diguanylate cyclase (GGDEF)-like protein
MASPSASNVWRVILAGIYLLLPVLLLARSTPDRIDILTTALIFLGAMFDQEKQRRNYNTFDLQKVTFNSMSIWFVVSIFLTPLLVCACLAVAWWLWCCVRLSGVSTLRRAEMTGQYLVPMMIAGVVVQHAHPSPFISGQELGWALLVVTLYQGLNFAVVLAHAILVQGRTLRQVIHPLSLWGLDACTAAVGLIAVLAANHRPFALVLLLPLLALVRASVLHPQLQRQAHADVKTGLLNDAGLRARANGLRVFVAVLMIDLDDFKVINDRFGHAAGDLVLKEVASRITSAVRISDDVSRFGGDEFVVIARAESELDAWRLAERIRSSVADRPVQLPEGGSATVTVSLGCWTGTPAAAGWLEAALASADAALYQAKDTGKDRIAAG